MVGDLRKTRSSPKREAIRRQGCLNPHPDAVLDPVFVSSDFFDPRDLVQVKYEMLRRVHVEGQTICASAKAFGFSRPSFYQSQVAFQRGGLPALIPRKRGPRRAHKLDQDVVRYLQQRLAKSPHLGSAELKALVQERFGISVHVRSEVSWTPLSLNRAARSLHNPWYAGAYDIDGPQWDCEAWRQPPGNCGNG